MNIYVGNLSFNAGDDDLKEAFAAYGSVESASIIRDKYSGQSRGFGFVEMDDDVVDGVVEALNGIDFGGRSLRVNLAKPKEDRGRRRPSW